MKKYIYFVRHGESQANANNRNAKENSLTEKGIEQAKAVANRFKSIPIDTVVHTSKIRSQQTALEIKAVKDVPVIQNDLFLERNGDFEFLWEFKDLSDAEKVEAFRIKYKIPDWDYLPEEQELFEHLRERSKKAIQSLENMTENNIVVVTHGVFVRFLVAHLIFKDTLTEDIAAQFIIGTAMENTGITMCKFYSETKSWKLHTLNDQAHLG